MYVPDVECCGKSCLRLKPKLGFVDVAECQSNEREGPCLRRTEWLHANCTAAVVLISVAKVLRMTETVRPGGVGGCCDVRIISI